MVFKVLRRHRDGREPALLVVPRLPLRPHLPNRHPRRQSARALCQKRTHRGDTKGNKHLELFFCALLLPVHTIKPTINLNIDKYKTNNKKWSI